MQRIRSILIAILACAFVLPACSASPSQISSTATPIHALKASPVPSEDLPRTEADVPRISVEDAKAALDSGAAVVVDVRTSGTYETSHIKGAISVPLGDIERDLTSLTLDKEQWIITYCT